METTTEIAINQTIPPKEAPHVSQEELLYQFVKSFLPPPYLPDGQNIVEEIQQQLDVQFIPIDRCLNNKAFIEAQQANPGDAIVEKVSNSFDSVTELVARQYDIPLVGDSAPQSNDEIIEMFKSKGVDFTSMGWKIQMLSYDAFDTRKSSDPITISTLDQGMGIHPSEFKNTVCTLMKTSEKSNQKCMRGRYGVGSRAILAHLKKDGFEIVISRRHPDYLKEGQKDLVGVTIFRKSNHQDRYYEYMVDKNGEVLYFDPNKFPVEDFFSLLGAKNVDFTHGMLTLTYNINLSSEFHGLHTFSLRRYFESVFYYPPFPWRLTDLRHIPRHEAKSKIRQMSGNKRRLSIEDKKQLECPPILFNFDLKEGKIYYTVLVTKKAASKYGNDYVNRKHKAYPFIIGHNGQRYASETTNKLLHSFPELMDTTLIIVECSGLTDDAKSDLFVVNKTEVRKGSLYEKINKRIQIELKECKELIEINNKRLEERNQLNESDPQDMFKNLATNKKMQKLLAAYANGIHTPGKLQIELPGVTGKASTKPTQPNTVPLDTKYFPTIFEPTKPVFNMHRGTKTNPKIGVLKFRTDAQSNFFTRSEDKGELRLFILDVNTEHNTTFNSIGGKSVVPLNNFFTIHSRLNYSTYLIEASLVPETTTVLYKGDELKILAMLSPTNGNGVITSECIISISKDPPKIRALPEGVNKDTDKVGTLFPNCEFLTTKEKVKKAVELGLLTNESHMIGAKINGGIDTLYINCLNKTFKSIIGYNRYLYDSQYRFILPIVVSLMYEQIKDISEENSLDINTSDQLLEKLNSKEDLFTIAFYFIATHLKKEFNKTKEVISIEEIEEIPEENSNDI